MDTSRANVLMTIRRQQCFFVRTSRLILRRVALFTHIRCEALSLTIRAPINQLVTAAMTSRCERDRQNVTPLNRPRTSSSADPIS
jgi:hypothetical protein